MLKYGSVQLTIIIIDTGHPHKCIREYVYRGKKWYSRKWNADYKTEKPSPQQAKS